MPNKAQRSARYEELAYNFERARAEEAEFKALVKWVCRPGQLMKKMTEPEKVEFRKLNKRLKALENG